MMTRRSVSRQITYKAKLTPLCDKLSPQDLLVHTKEAVLSAAPGMIDYRVLSLSESDGVSATVQEKRRLEEERQRELNELFAQAIKQPKVAGGAGPLDAHPLWMSV